MINKVKDNMEKNNEYVDMETIADNFDGSEEQLKLIAKDIYEICSQGFDEDFTDNAKSMLDNSHPYLNRDQYNKILYELLEELISNDGKFVEEKELCDVRNNMDFCNKCGFCGKGDE